MCKVLADATAQSKGFLDGRRDLSCPRVVDEVGVNSSFQVGQCLADWPTGLKRDGRVMCQLVGRFCRFAAHRIKSKRDRGKRLRIAGSIEVIANRFPRWCLAEVNWWTRIDNDAADRFEPQFFVTLMKRKVSNRIAKEIESAADVDRLWANEKSMVWTALCWRFTRREMDFIMTDRDRFLVLICRDVRDLVLHALANNRKTFFGGSAKRGILNWLGIQHRIQKAACLLILPKCNSRLIDRRKPVYKIFAFRRGSPTWEHPIREHAIALILAGSIAAGEGIETNVGPI